MDKVSSGDYVRIEFCSRLQPGPDIAENELTLKFNDVQLNSHRVTIACLIGFVNDIIDVEFSPNDSETNIVSVDLENLILLLKGWIRLRMNDRDWLRYNLL